jgi:hypothetical protein
MVVRDTALLTIGTVVGEMEAHTTTEDRKKEREEERGQGGSHCLERDSDSNNTNNTELQGSGLPNLHATEYLDKDHDRAGLVTGM